MLPMLRDKLVHTVIISNVYTYLPATEATAATLRFMTRKLAIECYDDFKRKVLRTRSKNVLWLADSAGEIVMDLGLIEKLVSERKHRISIGISCMPYKVKVTEYDMAETLKNERFASVRELVADGRIRTVPMPTMGMPQKDWPLGFEEALRESDLIISKGVDNYIASYNVNRDRFYLLVSMSRDEILRHNAPWIDGWDLGHSRYIGIEGLVLAFIPKGVFPEDRTLSSIILSRKKR